MKLSVGNFSFQRLPLDATLMVCKSLGFGWVDLGVFAGETPSQIAPKAIAEDPRREADKLAALLDKHGLRASDLFTQFGPAHEIHSINDPDPAVRAEDLRQLQAVAQLCSMIGCPGITILPGMEQAGRSQAENIAESIAFLRQAVDITGEQGVELRFEPHIGAVAYSPELALELVHGAPGLKVTLDLSHFVQQYIPLERVWPLVPHTGHVHIRSARAGKLQTMWRENTIDFPGLIQRLGDAGYQGALCIEYVCGDWYDVNQIDTITETYFARQALAPLVGA
ncbi:MAG: sugar phosphate isomerase/epimerase [Pleurocapsa minor GSE-CHR-MK-17-07R]|nr:sugar phosphate isomerase/epimerase [Pleurocapsa minor GSE-CHR-MK 17-07R]